MLSRGKVMLTPAMLFYGDVRHTPAMLSCGNVQILPIDECDKTHEQLKYQNVETGGTVAGARCALGGSPMTARVAALRTHAAEI